MPHHTSARWIPRLVAAGLLTAPAGLSGQMSVTPSALQIPAADTTASATVRVRNDSPRQIQFRFYAMDFEQVRSGDYTYQPLGAHAQSCGKRLSIYPDGAVLQPGESQVVRVEVAPGSGLCWSMLFAESAGEGSGPIKVAQRAAVKVFGVAPGGEPEGEIVSVTPTRDARGTRVTLEFHNTGSVPVNPEGSLEIRKPDGEVAGSVAVPRFSVLPQHRRQVVLELEKGLPRGRYLLVPILDFGAEYLAGGQATLIVP
ncbi:MAG: hypothetical protein M3P24_09900 [Gemmatimonadota bacterium]|nr:hypothetical protein [Gemmatimonadota bacterium]